MVEEALLELEVSWLPNLKPGESLAPKVGVVPNLNPPVVGKDGAEEEEGAPNLKPVELVVVGPVVVVPAAARKGEGPEEVVVVVRMSPPPGPTAPGAGPLLKDWGGTDPAHTHKGHVHTLHTHNVHVSNKSGTVESNFSNHISLSWNFCMQLLIASHHCSRT